MKSAEKFKGKKVLVTGGSGFFASHIVHALQSAGAKVAILTKYNSIIDNVRLAGVWDEIEVLEADLRNTDSLRYAAEWNPEVVFHFAAYNHVGDSFHHVQESLMTNAVGTANLMDAFQKYQRFIYIATSEVYGYQTEVPFTESMRPFPTSPYSIGKYAGELFAQMQQFVYNRPITMIRPFNVFGPYQSPRAIIAEMIIKCLRGETILSTEGKQTRDFNYVTNLVDGILMAATHEETIGKTLNIGSGEEITIRDLIQKIHRLCESQSELKIGALPNRPTEIWRMQADSIQAREVLGWRPEVSLDEGLKKTVDWYRKFVSQFMTRDSGLSQLGNY